MSQEAAQRRKRRQSVPWSEDEDRRLTELVAQNGPTNWKSLSALMPYPDNGRTGKQLRERFTNVLDPNINRSCWRIDEEQLIIEFLEIYEQVKIKNMWAQLAKLMINRPANAIKNHWHSTLKRFVVRAKEKVEQRETHYTVELPRSNSNAERDEDTFLRVKFYHPGDPIEERLRVSESPDEDDDECETPVATPQTPTSAMGRLSFSTPQTPTGTSSSSTNSQGKERMIRRRKRVTINERADRSGSDSAGDEDEAKAPRTRAQTRQTTQLQPPPQVSLKRIQGENKAADKDGKQPQQDEADEEADDPYTLASPHPPAKLVHAPSPFTPVTDSSAAQLLNGNGSHEQAHDQAKREQMHDDLLEQESYLPLETYVESHDFLHDQSQPQAFIKRRRIELSAPPMRRQQAAGEPQLAEVGPLHPLVFVQAPVLTQHQVIAQDGSGTFDNLLLGWEQPVLQQSQRQEALEAILQNDDEGAHCWSFGSSPLQHQHQQAHQDEHMSPHAPHGDPLGMFNLGDSTFFLPDL